MRTEFSLGIHRYIEAPMADKWSLLPFLSLHLSLVAMLVLPMADAGEVRALFVFGDSTVDVGTNNFLPHSTARADFPHNGIDFPRARPTGRFSNGFNTADFLAKLMGFRRSPPPFLSLTNSTFPKQIGKGVSFASGGAGILYSTGSNYGVIPMGAQIQQFEMVRGNLVAQMGEPAANVSLSKSVFLVSVGSNDIFQNFPPSDKDKFIEDLTSKYKDQLSRLYQLGARKFGIISIPNIGCCPSLRAQNATGGCIDGLNEIALKFHGATHSLLNDLSSKLTGMKYSLGNSIEMVANVFHNPHHFGFKELTEACCGKGRLNGESPCLPNASLCSNRHEYLFWDMYHPTQAASKLAAQTLYYGPQIFVSPINFKTLAQADC